MPENEESIATSSPAIDLWAEVAGAATTKGSEVRKLVISELVDKEIIKRKNAVLALLSKYEEKSKSLKKSEKSLVKVEYDVDGKETRRYYDNEGSKTLKSIREELTNFSNALQNFFDKNDPKRLYELQEKK